MVIVEVQFRMCADVIILVAMMNCNYVNICVYVNVCVCINSFNVMEIKRMHLEDVGEGIMFSKLLNI